MKWVTVTQWVRAGMAQVPPDQSLTSRSVVNPHAIPVRGCVKPGIARMQAALLSLEMFIVVDLKDKLEESESRRRCYVRKAAVLDTLG